MLIGTHFMLSQKKDIESIVEWISYFISINRLKTQFYNDLLLTQTTLG